MYQPEDPLGMQQFTEPPLPPPVRQEQEQYYASPPPNPFHPSQNANFQRFGSSPLSNLPFGVTTKSDPGQSSSNILSFGSPRSLNFSSNWQDETAGLQVSEKRSRVLVNAQDHVVAERKRREKLQQQFMALATIIPGLKKTDKISLLGSTIDYVKQLEEKVKTLEKQGTSRTAGYTVFESKCCISTDDDASNPSRSLTGESNPMVEASIRSNTVLLKIFCKERRGVLVMVLSELEKQGLSIINTNVVPFTDSSLNITITAKIEEGFSTAVELVKNLNMALRSLK